MKLIIACDPAGGIGYQNRLPWTNIQGDLPRFKRLTHNKTIVMGRNTWDSLPKKPLPDRFHIVITSQDMDCLAGVVIKSMDDFLSTTGFDLENNWIIGGARLIETSWSLIDEVHLTRVYDQYTCDTFIDLIYLEANFKRTYSEMFPDHMYEIWKRK